MGFNQSRRSAAQQTTNNWNGSVAGTAKAAAAFAAYGATQCSPGTLTANITTAITTSSLVLTNFWEISQDGVTFSKILASNGAPYVPVAAAGTGSPVSTSYVLAAPRGATESYPYVRVSTVSSGATGVTADTCQLSYNYIMNHWQ